MKELAQLPEGERVSLLVRYRSGLTRLVLGRVTTCDSGKAVLTTAGGGTVELVEEEIDKLFRLPLD